MNVRETVKGRRLLATAHILVRHMRKGGLRYEPKTVTAIKHPPERLGGSVLFIYAVWRKPPNKDSHRRIQMAPSFFPTFLNFSSAKLMCSGVWAALTWTRIRDLPFGTTG